MHADSQILNRRRVRPALLELIAQAEVGADSAEADFLAQLRAVVAATQSPIDRLRACYRDWPSAPAVLCDKYRD